MVATWHEALTHKKLTPPAQALFNRFLEDKLGILLCIFIYALDTLFLRGTACCPASCGQGILEGRRIYLIDRLFETWWRDSLQERSHVPQPWHFHSRWLTGSSHVFWSALMLINYLYTLSPAHLLGNNTHLKTVIPGTDVMSGIGCLPRIISRSVEKMCWGQWVLQQRWLQ